MNKISLYVFLILVYLGLSKSFSPTETRSPFLADQSVFDSYFQGAPLTVILLDSISSGFLIKTYLHKYKLVYAFRPPEEISVRVSKDFWEKNLKNHGLSLFRRKDNSSKSNAIVMPPGTLFIGDPSYGSWVTTDYGEKVWEFHRTYKNFKEMLGWTKFTPSFNTYQKMKSHLANEISFRDESAIFFSYYKVKKDGKVKSYWENELKPTLLNYFNIFITVPSWEIKSE